MQIDGSGQPKRSSGRKPQTAQFPPLIGIPFAGRGVDRPRVVIREEAELCKLRVEVAAAADAARAAIARCIEQESGLRVLSDLKFTRLGRHPLDLRGLNIVEQVNQTFTYLVSFAAAKALFARHANAAPIVLNLGTASGSDVESASAGVAAEVFAAVNPGSNRKLARDLSKVSQVTEARHKYIFYYCPGEEAGERTIDLFPGVRVISLPEAALWPPP